MRGAMFWLVLLAGCTAATAVHTEYDHSVDFSRYRAYDWLREPAGAEPAPAGSLDEQLRKAVNNELLGRGLRRSSQPDFLVGFRAPGAGTPSGARARGPEADAAGSGAGRDSSGDLVLEFVDAKSRKSIWRGTAATHWQGDPQAAQVEAAVRDLLAAFPPGRRR